MELPRALESVFEALLDGHAVSSWKVACEGLNPILVVRMKPVSENRERQDVNTQAYRRKQPSQVARDKRRLTEHRDRLRLENGNFSESRTNFNTDNSKDRQFERSDSANDSTIREFDTNKTKQPCVSSLARPPSPPLVPAVTRATRSEVTEMDTGSGGSGDGSDESGESGESDGGEGVDTVSDSENESTDKEPDKNVLRNWSSLVRKRLMGVTGKSLTRDMLKQKQRNGTFDKVVLDRRGPGVPRLLCRTHDILMTCDTGTRVADFLFIHESTGACELAKCVEEWPEIDRGGTYKKLIEKMNDALSKCMTLVREMI